MKFFGTPYVTRRLGPSPMLAKAKQGNVVVIMKFGPELPPEMLLDIREKLKEALRRKKWPREQDRAEAERLVDDPKTPEAVLAPLLALAEDNEVDVLERKDESIENAQQTDEVGLPISPKRSAANMRLACRRQLVQPFASHRSENSRHALISPGHPGQQRPIFRGKGTANRQQYGTRSLGL